MLSAFLLTSVTSFLLCAFGTRFLIPKLRQWRMGQTILQIGPHWHEEKSGTPTMGGVLFLGLFFLLAIALQLLSTSYPAFQTDLPLWITLLYAILNGAIGVFDDLTKFTKQQNEGLSAKQKFLPQLLFAILYLIVLRKCSALSTELTLGFGLPTIQMGIFTYPFMLLLLVGMVNSVNLTDGIDGLAASVTSVVATFFLLCAVLIYDFPLILCSSCLLGICFGFLCFNKHPAKIFMGDTGSLFLGGCVAGFACYLQRPILLLPIGIWYWIETASVILQVGYYKLTHKRLFKMAPFHHHLEQCGDSEQKIVRLAVLLTAIGAFLAFLAF